MITRIEIDGFKTFSNFAVDLAPFQVIIGANGCGKSNLFDALDLLSGLAVFDVLTAFKRVRGDINERFTVLPNGQSADRMRLAVEMIIRRASFADSEGKSHVDYPRVRYEVEIRRRTTTDVFEQIYIEQERILEFNTHLRTQRPTMHELRSPRQMEPDKPAWTRQTYIEEQRVEYGYYDGTCKSVNSADGAMYSVVDALTEPFLHLSPVTNYVQDELKHIRLARYDTHALRKPSSYFEISDISPIGENLPAVLARFQTQDKHLLRDVSRDVANIVSGVAEVRPERNERHKQFALSVTTRDGRNFTADALSEGTLRVLALAALRHDPQLRGTVCFEDPETGVHPGALKRIVGILRSMTTDFNDPEQTDEPLRQVLVTSHSPNIVSELNIEAGELLYAELIKRIEADKPTMQVTRMQAVQPDGLRTPERTYALSQVIKFLNGSGLEATQEGLREAFVR